MLLCFSQQKFNSSLILMKVSYSLGRGSFRHTKYPTSWTNRGARIVLKSIPHTTSHIHFKCLWFWGHTAYVTVYTAHISLYIVAFCLTNKKYNESQCKRPMKMVFQMEALHSDWSVLEWITRNIQIKIGEKTKAEVSAQFYTCLYRLLHWEQCGWTFAACVLG